MVEIFIRVGDETSTYRYSGERPIRLGRLPSCDVPLGHSDVSREHAEIRPDGKGGFEVLDLESKNGILLNGRKVDRAPLAPGDEIRLCPEVRVAFGEPLRAPVPQPVPEPVPQPVPEPVPEPAPAPRRPGRFARLRRPRSGAEKLVVRLGILGFFAAVGWGAYRYVIPEMSRHDAVPVAGAGAGGRDGAEAAGTGAGTGTGALGDPGAAEDEREWARIERLDVPPVLLATALEAYAKRYPGSIHARPAVERAAALRKLGAGATAAGGTGTGTRAGTHAGTGTGTGSGTGTGKEGDAAGRWLELRARARGLAQGGKALEALELVAREASGLAKGPIAAEVEAEIAALRKQVEAAIEAGAPLAPRGEGDRALLEKLLPEAKRATIACDFDGALERYRQILNLPLTDEERLGFQWRIFDIARARLLFHELLARVAETATGASKDPPLQMTLYQSVRGDVVDADRSEIKVAIKFAETREPQLWIRRWKDLTPPQTLEVFRGLKLDGDGLVALAAFCFEADHEHEAQAALIEVFTRWPAFKAEAAALLRRRTGTNTPTSDLVVFEGRLLPSAEKAAALKRRAEAAAEAARLKEELLAAKRDQSGRTYLGRALALIEGGMYVEGRLGLAEIARRFEGDPVGAEARARLDDAFLRRRPIRVTGRDRNRVSIYAMAEGYACARNAEQEAFDAVADRAQRLLARADFWQEYAGYHNYYAMNLASKEPGVDREPGGVKKETPLGGEVDQGVFTINNGLARTFLERFPGPSVGVAIGNDNASVATGGGGCCAIVKGMIDVAGHEIGHAFAGLGDEYDMDPGGGKPSGPGGRAKGPLPTSILAPNLVSGNQRDDLRRNAPWAHWLPLGPANWTNRPVDLVEGGSRTPFDVWRPQQDCRMRTSSSNFCAVCMEQMVLHLYAAVRPIDETDPKDEKVEVDDGKTIDLKATLLRPKSRPLDWRFEIAEAAESVAPDGSTVAREKKAKRLENVRAVDLPDPDRRTLVGARVTAPPGLYDVTLVVSDPTPWVQVKERPGLEERRVWRLRVRGKR